MTQVNLSLSRDEYRRLLLFTLLGEEVYGTVMDARGSYEEDAGALAEKLLKIAQGEGLREAVRHEDHADPAPHFDAELREIMDDYDDEAFWDELERRLVRRDAERQGIMSGEGAAAARELLRERYAAEFKTYGVDRLEINTNAPVSDIRGALGD